jgi:plastocyanin
MPLTSLRFVPALLLVLAAAACGDDDDPAAADATDCEPVGTDIADDAVETIDVELSEYAFAPATLSAGAGVVTFEARNTGEERHELAFLPGGGEVPLTDEGTPDEEALTEAGAFELEAFSPDQTCAATFALDSGSYTVFCIVEADDGHTHYEKGMRGTLDVG